MRRLCQHPNHPDDKIIVRVNDPTGMATFADRDYEALAYQILCKDGLTAPLYCRSVLYFKFKVD